MVEVDGVVFSKRLKFQARKMKKVDLDLKNDVTKAKLNS